MPVHVDTGILSLLAHGISILAVDSLGLGVMLLPFLGSVLVILLIFLFDYDYSHQDSVRTEAVSNMVMYYVLAKLVTGYFFFEFFRKPRRFLPASQDSALFRLHLQKTILSVEALPILVFAILLLITFLALSLVIHHFRRLSTSYFRRMVLAL